MATSAGTVVVNVQADTSQFDKQMRGTMRRYFGPTAALTVYGTFLANLSLIVIAIYLACHW